MTQGDAHTNVTRSRPLLPTSLRSPAKCGPEREVGERQLYCHTNALDVGLVETQCVFFSARLC